MSEFSGRSSDFSDTNSDLYNQEVVVVGTTQVEAITSALTDTNDRQFLLLFNKGNATVYYGPTGVTASSGLPLRKDEWVELAISGISVFLITSSSTADVIVTEMG